MNNSNYDNDNQFVLSFELLQLLEWLIAHQPEELKKIIHRSLSQGLNHQIQHADDILETYSPDQMQDNIIEFFNLLEMLLIESINERQVKKSLQTELIPAINHIDRSYYDSAALSSSIEKASAQLEKNNTKENPQNILYKELLKNWKPSKKAQEH